MNEYINGVHAENLEQDTERLISLIDIWRWLSIDLTSDVSAAKIEIIATLIMGLTEKLFRHKHYCCVRDIPFPSISEDALEEGEDIIKYERDLFDFVKQSFSTKKFLDDLDRFIKGWVDESFDPIEIELYSVDLANQYFILEVVVNCMERLVKNSRIPKRLRKLISGYRDKYKEAVKDIYDLAESTWAMAEVFPGGLYMANSQNDVMDVVSDTLLEDYFDQEGMGQ